MDKEPSANDIRDPKKYGVAMNVNRSYGTELIESMMIDTCRISNDFADIYDAELNETTGLLEQPDKTIVYEGKCLVSRMLTRDIEIIDGEMTKFVDNVKILIPYTEGADIKLGDHVQIISSINDPRAETIQFRVYSVEVFTHTVYRRIIARAVIDQFGSMRGSK